MSTTVLVDTTPAIRCAIRHFSATIRHMLDEVDMETEPDALNVQRRLHDLLAGYAGAIEANPKASDKVWMKGALDGISTDAPGYEQACELFGTVITKEALDELRRAVSVAQAAAKVAAQIAARIAARRKASV